jgi:hypothetical protein
MAVTITTHPSVARVGLGTKGEKKKMLKGKHMKPVKDDEEVKTMSLSAMGSKSSKHTMNVGGKKITAVTKVSKGKKTKPVVKGKKGHGKMKEPTKY